MVKFSSLVIVWGFVLFWSVSNFAQSNTKKIINTHPMIIESISINPQPFAAGANGQLEIKVNLPENHFAYKNKLKVEINRPNHTKVGPATIFPEQTFTDPLDKSVKKGIRDSAVIKSVFEIDENLPTGSHDFNVLIKYQACTTTYCLFPTQVEKTISIEIINHNSIKISKSPASVDSEKSELKKWFAKGTFFAFLFVFLGGVLTSLTPCIFPMLPVTLAVLGASGRNQSRMSRLGLSISYVLGIAVMYSSMGVVAASTGALFGSTMQNPWVVGVIATAFTLMALAMFGVWEFQVPSFLRNKLANKKTGTGHVGAFFTGAIAGIVASPCVGPVLFSILAYVAQTQDVFLGFALLFVFALGLGQIFIVIGLFSELLEKLPRAGVWMNSINFVFGVLMLGTAVYFLQFVVPENWTWITAGIAILIPGYIYGFHLSMPRIKPVAYIALLMGIASLGYGGFLVTGNSTTVKTVEKRFDWKPYSDDVIQESKGQPIMIDFYADWCVACKEFEKITFADAKVESILKKISMVKVDATDMTEEVEAILEKYGVLGLPTLVFINRKGEVMSDLTVTGFEDAPIFLKRLDKLMASKNE